MKDLAQILKELGTFKRGRGFCGGDDFKFTANELRLVYNYHSSGKTVPDLYFNVLPKYKIECSNVFKGLQQELARLESCISDLLKRYKSENYARKDFPAWLAHTIIIYQENLLEVISKCEQCYEFEFVDEAKEKFKEFLQITFKNVSESVRISPPNVNGKTNVAAISPSQFCVISLNAAEKPEFRDKAVFRLLSVSKIRQGLSVVENPPLYPDHFLFPLCDNGIVLTDGYPLTREEFASVCDQYWFRFKIATDSKKMVLYLDGDSNNSLTFAIAILTRGLTDFLQNPSCKVKTGADFTRIFENCYSVTGVFTKVVADKKFNFEIFRPGGQALLLLSNWLGLLLRPLSSAIPNGVTRTVNITAQNLFIILINDPDKFQQFLIDLKLLCKILTKPNTVEQQLLGYDSKGKRCIGNDHYGVFVLFRKILELIPPKIWLEKILSDDEIMQNIAVIDVLKDGFCLLQRWQRTSLDLACGRAVSPTVFADLCVFYPHKDELMQNLAPYFLKHRCLIAGIYAREFFAGRLDESFSSCYSLIAIFSRINQSIVIPERSWLDKTFSRSTKSETIFYNLNQEQQLLLLTDWFTLLLKPITAAKILPGEASTSISPPTFLESFVNNPTAIPQFLNDLELLCKILVQQNTVAGQCFGYYEIARLLDAILRNLSSALNDINPKCESYFTDFLTSNKNNLVALFQKYYPSFWQANPIREFNLKSFTEFLNHFCNTSNDQYQQLHGYLQNLESNGLSVQKLNEEKAKLILNDLAHAGEQLFSEASYDVIRLHQEEFLQHLKLISNRAKDEQTNSAAQHSDGLIMESGVKAVADRIVTIYCSKLIHEILAEQKRNTLIYVLPSVLENFTDLNDMRAKLREFYQSRFYVDTKIALQPIKDFLDNFDITLCQDINGAGSSQPMPSAPPLDLAEKSSESTANNLPKPSAPTLQDLEQDQFNEEQLLENGKKLQAIIDALKEKGWTEEQINSEVSIFCPIALEIPKQPVYIVGEKDIYEKEALWQHLRHSNLSPMTRQPIGKIMPLTNLDDVLQRLNKLLNNLQEKPSAPPLEVYPEDKGKGKMQEHQQPAPIVPLAEEELDDQTPVPVSTAVPSASTIAKIETVVPPSTPSTEVVTQEQRDGVRFFASGGDAAVETEVDPVTLLANAPSPSTVPLPILEPVGVAEKSDESDAESDVETEAEAEAENSEDEDDSRVAELVC